MLIDSKHLKREFNLVIKYVYLTFFGLVSLFPFLWVVLSSFKTNKEIMNAFSLPAGLNLTGYLQAIITIPLHVYTLNSCIVSVCTSTATVLFASMAAYAFTRFDFRFKKALYALLTVALFIPMTAMLGSMYVIVKSLNLQDNLFGLMLVYIGLNMPMALIIMKGCIEKLPRCLDEAAAIDGASPAQTFFSILLPAAKSGVVTTSVLSFINCMNEFSFALIIAKTDASRTLSLSFSFFTSQFSYNYPAMFAAITITILPYLFLFILFQSNIINAFRIESE